MESTDESQKCPEILYKYCGFKGGLATLENSSLRYRHPNEFNDPFEFLPGGYVDITIEEKRKRCIDVFASNPDILNKFNELIKNHILAMN